MHGALLAMLQYLFRTHAPELKHVTSLVCSKVEEVQRFSLPSMSRAEVPIT